MAEQVSVSTPKTIHQRIRKLASTRNQSVDDVLVEEDVMLTLVFRSPRLIPIS